MPWTERFYEELPRMEDGQLVLPDKPGLGLSFDQQALAMYAVG
jgi:L-alanine-DL-glutamate epimerase-like enolase superfamily enzyme